MPPTPTPTPPPPQHVVYFNTYNYRSSIRGLNLTFDVPSNKENDLVNLVLNKEHTHTHYSHKNTSKWRYITPTVPSPVPTVPPSPHSLAVSLLPWYCACRVDHRKWHDENQIMCTLTCRQTIISDGCYKPHLAPSKSKSGTAT